MDSEPIAGTELKGMSAKKKRSFTDSVEGVLLSEITGQPLGAATAIPILCQLCDELSAMHHQGRVHGDVRPSQVMVGRLRGAELVVRLLRRRIGRNDIEDFAAANETTLAADDWSAWDFACATSPDRGTSGDAEQRADVYAVGEIAYLLATGQPPQRIEGRLLSPRDLESSVSGEFSDAIMRALSFAAAERHLTAREFREALVNARGVANKQPSFMMVLCSPTDGDLTLARCTRLSSTSLFLDEFPRMPALGTRLRAMLRLDNTTVDCAFEVSMLVTNEQANAWGMAPGIVLSVIDPSPAVDALLGQLAG